MSGIRCPFPGCVYETDSADGAVAAAQLNIHAMTHSAAALSNNSEPKQKPPKMDRPSLSKGASEEDWNLFLQKWTLFKKGTSIPPGHEATHLWQCCDSELVSDLFKDVPNIGTVAETSLLESLKRLAVIKVAASVQRAELLALKQDLDSQFALLLLKLKERRKHVPSPSLVQNKVVLQLPISQMSL